MEVTKSDLKTADKINTPTMKDSEYTRNVMLCLNFLTCHF